MALQYAYMKNSLFELSEHLQTGHLTLGNQNSIQSKRDGWELLPECDLRLPAWEPQALHKYLYMALNEPITYKSRFRNSTSDYLRICLSDTMKAIQPCLAANHQI